MARLEGRVAFVTGAARGQGRAHVMRLAADGANLIGVDLARQTESVPYAMARGSDLVETARLAEAEGARIVALEADVRDADGLRRAFERGAAELGHVEIVVANAGICIPVTPKGGDERRSWQDTLDVNLTGVYHTIRAALPSMIDAGKGGSIVLIGSAVAIKPFVGPIDGGHLAYTASKSGLVGLTRAFATMLAPHGIRVNAVHPGGVNTPMLINETFEALWEESPDATSSIEIRLLEASDVSDAVAWLASDESRQVTGANLPVDAGLTL